MILFAGSANSTVTIYGRLLDGDSTTVTIGNSICIVTDSNATEVGSKLIQLVYCSYSYSLLEDSLVLEAIECQTETYIYRMA